MGPNLFQFKFQIEFDMAQILQDDRWSFDNQLLLFQRWQKGMTEEVEGKRRQDDLNYFMPVKVALLIMKPLRRRGFIADSDGVRTWVSFKYERLPLFCHYCGLLGHV